MGTALFIAVLSIRSSVAATVDDCAITATMSALPSAVFYRAAQVEPLAWQVPGVVAVESWLSGSARRVYADNSTSESIAIVAAPADTQLMEPELEAGRWLLPNEGNTVVVNTDLLATIIRFGAGG
ncbi:MAG: hypothetical protein R3E31_05080 [Chloroflexota bacterium]